MQGRVNKIEGGEEDQNRVFLSECGKFRYHIGVIDYLGEYTFAKSVETRWKSLVLKADVNTLSSMPPKCYGRRFLRFMEDLVFFGAKIRTERGQRA
mmetsp:Transcript_17201/g.28975  ORF Transcript_17201/g.28975 Transcript_17201/m.28975 type:complete len:96 (-) Transcript_17201:112-399(-)